MRGFMLRPAFYKKFQRDCQFVSVLLFNKMLKFDLEVFFGVIVCLEL